MPTPTGRVIAAATALVSVTVLFVSCDVGTLAPREPERERSSPSPSPSSLSTETPAFSASRVLEEGFALDEEGCARSPGFWCQNKDKDHPHMPAGTFEEYALGAIDNLEAEDVFVLELPEDVGAAVCDTGRQLLRHLTSVALNLAAGFVSESDPLTGEDPLLTVEDAFARGAEVYLMGDTVPWEERNEIKDVLDRINNNANIDNACTSEPGDDDGGGEEGGEGAGEGGSRGGPGGNGGSGPTDPTVTACAVDPDGKITICHLPARDPAKGQTIRISPNAWPAHEAHGDSCGSCS